MPKLDEWGHIPRDSILGANGLSWEDAAVACGIEEADVRARVDAEETVADVAFELAVAAGDYASAINVELELLPWSEGPGEIHRTAKEVVHVFSRFVVAAEEARAVLDASHGQVQPIEG